MEWLFGSMKKKNASPDVYVSSTVEGGFNVVSTSDPVRPIYTGEPARPPYPLYPTLPPGARAPAVYPPISASYGPPQQPPHPLQHHQYQQMPYGPQPTPPSSSVQKPVNPLDSIPFKLSSVLDSRSLPVNEYLLKSIKSQLDSISNRINSDSYNYTFELERSVLSEINYR